MNAKTLSKFHRPGASCRGGVLRRTRRAAGGPGRKVAHSKPRALPALDPTLVHGIRRILADHAWETIYGAGSRKQKAKAKRSLETLDWQAVRVARAIAPKLKGGTADLGKLVAERMTGGKG